MSGKAVAVKTIAKSGNPAKTKSAMKRMEIIARQNRVAELRLQGYSTAAIAEKLGICERQAKYDSQRVSQRWRESSIRNWDELIEIERLRLERIHQLAEEGYERSLQPKESVTVEKGESGGVESTKLKEEGQAGDPQFLQVMIRASESRRKLLGLDKPIANEHEHLHVHAHAHQHELKVVEDEKWYGNDAHDQVAEAAKSPIAGVIESSPVQGGGVRTEMGQDSDWTIDGD
jgi:hypothetical protein